MIATIVTAWSTEGTPSGGFSVLMLDPPMLVGKQTAYYARVCRGSKGTLVVPSDRLGRPLCWLSLYESKEHPSLPSIAACMGYSIGEPSGVHGEGL